MSVLAFGALPISCNGEASELPSLSEAESEAYFPQSLASGDPRPDSVVLWVRALDPDHPEQDAHLELLLAFDVAMTQPLSLSSDAHAMVTAADADHCLLVRVGSLMPGTTYYYRFRCRTSHGVAQSRIGRTRTAPAEDSTDAVRFAVMCCQDYGGKYFHVAHTSPSKTRLRPASGDYVYELRAIRVSRRAAERSVAFSAPAGARAGARGSNVLGRANAVQLPRSVQLYGVDPDLQPCTSATRSSRSGRSEFSDDSHGASRRTSTVAKTKGVTRATARPPIKPGSSSCRSTTRARRPRGRLGVQQADKQVIFPTISLSTATSFSVSTSSWC